MDDDQKNYIWMTTNKNQNRRRPKKNQNGRWQNKLLTKKKQNERRPKKIKMEDEQKFQNGSWPKFKMETTKKFKMQEDQKNLK